MPDSLVKSLPSSTSAFAGSQAAQHNVSCLLWADASVPPNIPNVAAASIIAAAPLNHLDRLCMCVPLVVKLSPRPRTLQQGATSTSVPIGKVMIELEREAIPDRCRFALAAPPSSLLGAMFSLLFYC